VVEPPPLQLSKSKPRDRVAALRSVRVRATVFIAGSLSVGKRMYPGERGCIGVRTPIAPVMVVDDGGRG
jgi:hypothetical protein